MSVSEHVGPKNLSCMKLLDASEEAKQMQSGRGNMD